MKTAFLPHIVPDPPVAPGCDPVPPTPPMETAVILLASQGQISAHRNAEGDLVLVERNWPDEDSTIIIAAQCLEGFIDRLTDLLGHGGARP